MKVLIIEDSPDIVDTVTLCFELRWPEVEVISTAGGKKGIALIKTENLSLVILDLGLPDMDGFEVLKDVRTFSDVPVIIVTVRGDEVDRVRGLELGADDYITKPFSHIELLARIKAVLRRTQLQRFETGRKMFSSPRLTIDFTSRAVTVDGNPVRLTPIEYNLLQYLVVNADTVLTHWALLEKVWGEEYTNAPEYLKVYIQRLRNKLEEDPSNPKLIISERGIGYKFAAPPSAS